jgi:CheY-like chemotaxis protein
MTASYACIPADPGDAALPASFGMADEVAKSGKATLLERLPQNYPRFGSLSGSAAPSAVLIVPIKVQGRVTGAFELGFSGARRDFSDALEFLESVAGSVGLALRSALYRQHLRELLEQTQRQSEEMQTQQEELRVSNEELEEQGNILRESQQRLEQQQAELEQSNVQLEEQAQRLEAQKAELLRAQRRLQQHASELERASRYKSEFLANMSHELRTPLNSSLILSQILGENRSGKLSDDEVRYARTIHASNSDLLTLINDILDLSKIEAGHAHIAAAPLAIADVLSALRAGFEPLAAEKGLRFTLEVAHGTPPQLVSDNLRLQQILKNLLSNAFKFTRQGEVSLRVSGGAPGRLLFAVRDTGIGIPAQQQEVIFDAFRQADGSTSRQYGGTGLGLSISRELARLLGGEIRVDSEEGRGSTFTLEIADELAADAAAQPAPAPVRPAASFPPAPATAPAPAAAAAPGHADDRAARQRERLILVIEDDARFAAVLYQLAHELDFDCIVTALGSEAIALAREQRPSGILLDVGLPDQSGLGVLELLKRDPATRHIPVHMMSAEDHMQAAMALGAVGYAFKPVARAELVTAIRRLEEQLQTRARKVLVVEDDAALRANIKLLLAADDIQISTAGSIAEALALVGSTSFDCMVMDLTLPDGSGYELLEQISNGGQSAFPPAIVYTGRALSRQEEQALQRYSKAIIIKGAKSPERLLDEVSLFLHRVVASLPQDQQRLLSQARQRDAIFEGRKILLAEDDVRNIFALSSIFEPLGVQLIIARNGREALQHLEKHSEIDLVLMDLMMPEMDGLEAMRELRRKPEWARLPVIALTAKAMPDDRRNCLDAGASDYIAKPIDVDKLVSLCRVWMPPS